MIRTYSGTEEAELHIFGSQGKAEVWKRNFTSWGMKADLKSESATSAIWQSKQSRSAEAGNFTSLEVPAEMKCGSGTSHLWKSWQNKCGSGTWDLFKSWQSGSVESGISDLWQSRLKCGSEASDLKQSWQSGNVKAKLQIFGRQGWMEVRKGKFTSLHELAEQKCGTELMSHHR